MSKFYKWGEHVTGSVVRRLVVTPDERIRYGMRCAQALAEAAAERMEAVVWVDEVREDLLDLLIALAHEAKREPL